MRYSLQAHAYARFSHGSSRRAPGSLVDMQNSALISTDRRKAFSHHYALHRRPMFEGS